MPTPQEAAYYYRYYIKKYNVACSQQSGFRKQLEESIAEKGNKERTRSDKRALRKSVEERLREVKRVISHFDNNVTNALGKANRASTSAGEKYTSSIRCSGLSSASIQSVFYSKSIAEDGSMLSPAYRDCNTEKAKLDNTIQTSRKILRRIIGRNDY